MESDNPKLAIASILARGNEDAILLLDLALDYMRYLKIKSKDKLSEQARAFQTELLLARSELPSRLQEVSISEEEIALTRPDQGHETARSEL